MTDKYKIVVRHTQSLVEGAMTWLLKFIKRVLWFHLTELFFRNEIFFFNFSLSQIQFYLKFLNRPIPLWEILNVGYKMNIFLSHRNKSSEDKSFQCIHARIPHTYTKDRITLQGIIKLSFFALTHPLCVNIESSFFSSFFPI